MRRGATAWTAVGSACIGRFSLGGRTGPAWDPRGSGDLPAHAASLLLGETAPDAVPLAVLDRPCEALLADPATDAERERRSRLVLGDGKEQIGVDAETRRSVLPVVRWGRVLRQCVQVDVREPLDPQQASLPSTPGVAGPVGPDSYQSGGCLWKGSKAGIPPTPAAGEEM